MGDLNELHTDDEAMREIASRFVDEVRGAATDPASVAEDEAVAFLREFDAQVESDIRPELEAAAFTMEQPGGLVVWITEEVGEAGGRPVAVSVALHVSRRGPEQGEPDPATEMSLVLEALPEVRFVRVTVHRRGEQHAIGAFTLSHLDQTFVEELATSLLTDLAQGDGTAS